MSSLTEIPKKELYANDLYLLGSSHNWIVSIFQLPYNQSGVKLKLYLQSDSFVIELFSKLWNFQQSCQSKFCFQVWCYCLSRRFSLTASMEHVFACLCFFRFLSWEQTSKLLLMAITWSQVSNFLQSPQFLTNGHSCAHNIDCPTVGEISWRTGEKSTKLSL